MTDTPVPEQSATPDTEPAPEAPAATSEANPPAEAPAPAAEAPAPAAEAPAPAAEAPAPAADAPAPAADAPAPEAGPTAAAGTAPAEPRRDAPRQGAGQGQGQSRPPRPRRRRMTAAERHRRTFFAKLTELRKQEQAALAGGPEPTDDLPAEPAAESPAPETAPVADAPAEAPVAEAPVAEAEAPAPAPAPEPAPQPAARQSEPPATSPSRSARAQARLVAAIERVGGAEAVLEALQPKHRDDGETMKWSSVCAEEAQGHKPGDPMFTAWVRLAATPVRDVKGIVSPRNRDDGRGRRGGRSGGGGGYRGGGGGYGGGGYGGGGYGGGRGARREDIESHGRDGSFRSSVRFVMVDADGSRKEPEDPQEAVDAAERLARSSS